MSVQLGQSYFIPPAGPPAPLTRFRVGSSRKTNPDCNVTESADVTRQSDGSRRAPYPMATRSLAEGDSEIRSMPAFLNFPGHVYIGGGKRAHSTVHAFFLSAVSVGSNCLSQKRRKVPLHETNACTPTWCAMYIICAPHLAK